jgi:hypothetical protein
MKHTHDPLFDRRTVLVTMALAMTASRSLAAADTRPEVRIWKDPSCGCCGAWGDHLARAGFPMHVVEVDDMRAVKHRLGVPGDLQSCHTAEVGKYVLEGHVPAIAVVRLLAERPDIRGLAVAGMPIGSPGMEVNGMAPDTYMVSAFMADGTYSDFMKFTGASPSG